ncbi:MAG: hypothetical protein AAF821_26860, partial [Cyanobacteria bacterium P01_D01_bin.156]
IIDLADEEILAIIQSAERFTHALDITERSTINPSLAHFFDLLCVSPIDNESRHIKHPFADGKS